MTSLIRPAVVLFVLLTLITGVVYPMAVTGIAQVAFPSQAVGSVITNANGQAIGSSLIGQEFSAGDPKDTAKWFWGRLSATSPVPYTSFNADKSTGSSGSNLAPTNPALVDAVKGRIDALVAADSAAGYSRPAGQLIPVDLATASASGLDPHISLAAAEYQLGRVAKARGTSEDSVRELLRKHTQARAMGVLGEPVVNVLELNQDLSQRSK